MIWIIRSAICSFAMWKIGFITVTAFTEGKGLANLTNADFLKSDCMLRYLLLVRQFLPSSSFSQGIRAALMPLIKTDAQAYACLTMTMIFREDYPRAWPSYRLLSPVLSVGEMTKSEPRERLHASDLLSAKHRTDKFICRFLFLDIIICNFFIYNWRDYYFL